MRAAIVCALLVCLLACAVGHAFEVSVLPPDPQGGEAVLVRIAHAPPGDCRIAVNEKEYHPFLQKSGIREIFLPLAVDAAGPQHLTVRCGEEERMVTIPVRTRVTTLVQLRESDEAMRDKQRRDEQQQQAILAMLRSVSPSRLWRKAFTLPLKNPISTQFAVHRKGKTYDYYHRGLDFSAPEGTLVRAINVGRVVLSRKKLNVYGNTLIVDHGQGVVSCYFHLSKLLKAEGATVYRGEMIGRVGSTGWASGPHLHMGVYVQGVPIDPIRFIALSALDAR